MIIGISGKIGSGKDTVGKIIQDLTTQKFDWKTSTPYIESTWQIKKFAGKLKQIVSILTGISVEDLKKQEVKDRVLGEEWWSFVPLEENLPVFDYYAATGTTPCQVRKLTIRQLLQLCGTEAMRNVIHPNVWVNALFADYKMSELGKIKLRRVNNSASNAYALKGGYYPNWIITDMRFPNELQAIKDRGGISIRVNRELKQYDRTCFECKKGFDFEESNKNLQCPYCKSISNAAVLYEKSNHLSETSLDNAEFDYTIDNNSTIEELIEKVKSILIKEKII